MPNSILQVNSNRVVVHGEVPDAMEFIREQGIMIVPLFSGSGIRIKVLEGMALGKSIVGTTKAFEGISVSQKECITSDDAKGFCEAIEKLHLDEQLRKEMGENARNFVKKNFNNDEIIAQLIEFYATI
jgi:glycosyltransferase involved in cell wall biosynthesis